MATKTNELRVDDLLNDYSVQSTKTKGTKDVKKPKTSGWEEEEDDNYSFALGKNTTGTTKPKTTKKKVQDKGWGDIKEEAKPQAQAQVEEEAPKTEEPKKKGIMNMKKIGENKPTAASVDVAEEYFPTLGEEVKNPPPKKKTEPAPTISPPVNSAQQSAGGPRKFMNAKKEGTGMNFAPLDPELAEKPVPVPQPRAETTETPAPKKEGGFIVRRTEPLEKTTPAPTPVEENAEGKFKFGGEGPRKFQGGNKISFKREEEKSEQERLREQKEREVEEKLAKDREEQSKFREARDAKKAYKEQDGAKPENGEQAQPQEGQTEERKPKFLNTKKDTSKPNPLKAEPKAEKPAQKEEKPAAKTEELASHPVDGKPVQAKEVVEMNGTLSNKGWGEGPIKKTAKK